MDKIFLENSFEFCNSISDKDKELFLSNVKIRDVEPNVILFDSTSCNGIMLVMEGKLRVYIMSEEGKEITIYTLEPGDICVLSVACITGLAQMKAIVETKTTSKIAIIDNDIFMDIHARNVAVQQFVMTEMSARMNDIMWTVEQIAFKSMDKRIAEYLLNQNKNIIYTTHEDIAMELGTAREVVSRLLKYLEKEDILELSRGKIKIVNKPLLIDRANG